MYVCVCAFGLKLRGMLRVGKHKGKTFEEVAGSDRNYCAWILRESSLPRSLVSFKKHLATNHGGVMPCGKHRSKFFDEVLRDDPDYAVWGLSLDDPSQALKPFIEYLDGHFPEHEEHPSQKKARTTPQPPKESAGTQEKQSEKTQQQCKICYEKEINAVYVPCGHHAACFECATKSVMGEKEQCPFCKQPVAMVLKTFAA